MSTGTKISLQGVVHKTVLKPPKLDEEGFVSEQDVEIVIRIPLSDGMRLKLSDLSRLQDGQTSYIELSNAQYQFDTTGQEPGKKPAKSKKKTTVDPNSVSILDPLDIREIVDHKTAQKLIAAGWTHANQVLKQDLEAFKEIGLSQKLAEQTIELCQRAVDKQNAA